MDDKFEKDDGRITMNVRMRLTPAQAIALEAMFSEWNYLGAVGKSRHVSFCVDGDGNFRPNVQVDYNPGISKEIIRKLKPYAIVDNNRCVFDYDTIAWKLREIEFCEHGVGMTDYCLPCGRIHGGG